jgi:hypothetical protein
MNLRSETRGAALIIAILILAILLVVVLTFFNASRYDVKIAQNVRNQTQADLLAEGGTAIAIAFLNHDLRAHSTYTSLDHAWKTYFNGAAFAGKPWTWKEFDGVPIPTVDRDGGTPMNGVVEIDLSRPGVFDQGDALYVPRVDLDGDPLVAHLNPWADYTFFANQYPFAVVMDPYNIGQTTGFQISPVAQVLRTAPFNLTGDRLDAPLLPDEQIHTWADVDNDGDGLRDSIYIPMPMDRYFGMDGRNAGRPGDPDDGIDNDLDGVIDEPGERAIFVYWGGNDGLDNNRDGVIDDTKEQRLYLTAPIVVDYTGDGVPDPVVLQNITYVIPASANTPPSGPLTWPQLDATPGSPDIDRLDNDYDLVVNDFRTYAYRYNPNGDPRLPALNRWIAPQDWHDPAIAPEFLDRDLLQHALNVHEEHFRRSYNEINVPRYIPGITDPNIHITASGEPVCELVGRIAVLITDEASKVNINTAGGLAYNPVWTLPATSPPEPVVMRALWDGASVHEYDLRVLPGLLDSTGTFQNIGVGKANFLWNYLMGAGPHLDNLPVTTGQGIGFAMTWDPAAVAPASRLEPQAMSAFNAPYAYDVSLPGYGLADDNGNALFLAMNGVDDDGDGFIDEGVNPAYPLLLGQFEGIDEPQEFQLFRPRRNLIAESDGSPTSPLDNNHNEIPNEIGELGDRVYRSPDMSKVVNSIRMSDFEEGLRTTTTVSSNDTNFRSQFVAIDPSTGQALPRIPELSGLKLDYNVASAPQIANALRVDYGYPASIVPSAANNPAYNFAAGLRRESAAIDLPFGTAILAGNVPNPWPADPELRAGQLAVNIQDSRDRNSGRATVTTTSDDPWYADLSGINRAINYTVAGIEKIRINEIMVRPVRRVEAEMLVHPEFGGNPAPYALVDAPTQFDPNPYYLLPSTGALFNVYNDPRLVAPDLAKLTALNHNGLQFHMVSRFALPPQPETDPDATTTGWAVPWGVPGRHLGAESTVRTALNSVTVPGVGVVPNIAEFRFGPSPQLPPGRYYLTMNGHWNEIDETTGDVVQRPLQPGDLLFLVKRGVAGDGIIDDLPTIPAGNPPVVPSAGVNPQGWVFLPGSVDVFVDPGTGLVDPYRAEYAYTVEIPPYDAPALQQYLYVAVWRNNPSIGLDELVINFFDFSQEPDHEWVELVNIDKQDPEMPLDQQSVDVSGWTVVVGDRFMRDVTGSLVPQQSVLEIPAGTVIPPGGRIILGVNKSDPSEKVLDAAQDGIIFRNGIALTRGGTNDLAAFNALFPFNFYALKPLGGFNYVTAVPEVDPAQVNALLPGAGPFEYVFSRALDTDFLDVTGNNLEDPGSLEFLVPTSARPVVDFDPFPAVPPVPENKAFDRVVEAAGAVQHVSGVDSVQALGDLLFRGGLFPNYPEHDLLDNDGDSTASGILADLVDNDGDGIIDEVFNATTGQFEGIGPDGPGAVDPDGRPEGIDEGRWEAASRVTHAPGSYMAQPRPNPTTGGIIEPGVQRYTFADAEAEQQTVLNFNDPAYTPGSAENVTVAPYVGAPADPPDWKAFAERRWYPGDCVPVSLYAGAPFVSPLVDRVTYTEQDVINRAVDDVITCPYRTAAGLPNTLDLRYPSMWPADNMVMDFYRTLERKHPQYTGDLRGVSNRWQATDGDYDDWSPSTTRWQYIVNDDLTLNPAGSVIDRLAAADGYYNLYANALSGSPLKMNLAERILENADNAFIQLRQPGDLIPDIQFAFRETRVRDRNYTSPGDLTRLPHMQWAVQTQATPVNDPTGRRP